MPDIVITDGTPVSGEAGPGSLAYYTTRAAVKQRLTIPGFRWAFDRDGTGTVSEAEAAAHIDPAIEYANNIVAAAIALIIDPTSDDAINNSWLRDRALDVAVYRAATTGGRRVPAIFKGDYDRAIALLDAVRDGTQAIPGIVTTTGGMIAQGISTITLHDASEPYSERDRRTRRLTF